MAPAVGAPGRLKAFEKKNSAGKAGDVAPVIPGAQIQAAPEMLERTAAQPVRGKPYKVAPDGQGEGADACRHTFCANPSEFTGPGPDGSASVTSQVVSETNVSVVILP